MDEDRDGASERPGRASPCRLEEGAGKFRQDAPRQESRGWDDHVTGDVGEGGREVEGRPGTAYDWGGVGTARGDASSLRETKAFPLLQAGNHRQAPLSNAEALAKISERQRRIATNVGRGCVEANRELFAAPLPRSPCNGRAVLHRSAPRARMGLGLGNPGTSSRSCTSSTAS